MNADEIKELIAEVKSATIDPMRRAELLANYLQAYHLAKISTALELLVSSTL